jgi:hypothetical protein
LNCKQDNLVDYKIEGYTEQKSKNIFPILSTPQTANGITLSYDKTDNSFVLSGTSTGPKSFEIITVNENYEEFRKGDSYTLSTYLVSGTTSSSQGPFIYIKDSYTNSNYVQKTVGVMATTPYIFTYDGDGYINRIAISINGTGHVYEDYKFRIQLEKGTSATEFEPHFEPTPDKPIEIESVGDKTSNLFDNDLFSNFKDYNYYSHVNGTYYKERYITSKDEFNSLTKDVKYNRIEQVTDIPESWKRINSETKTGYFDTETNTLWYAIPRKVKNHWDIHLAAVQNGNTARFNDSWLTERYDSKNQPWKGIIKHYNLYK